MYKDRINKIKGQVSGIEKMLDDKRTCMDVVQQIVAVRAALAKLGVEILKDEAQVCVKKNNRSSLEKSLDKLFKLS